jgi:hypothetical protein
MMIGAGLDARLGLAFDDLRAVAREAFGEEQRRERGATAPERVAAVPERVAAVPDEMLHATGITARPGPTPVIEGMAALTPARIRAS